MDIGGAQFYKTRIKNILPLGSILTNQPLSCRIHGYCVGSEPLDPATLNLN